MQTRNHFPVEINRYICSKDVLLFFFSVCIRCAVCTVCWIELHHICCDPSDICNVLKIFQHYSFRLFSLVVFRNVQESFFWKSVNDFHHSRGVHECMTLAKGHLEKEGLCFCIVAVRSIDSYFRWRWGCCICIMLGGCVSIEHRRKVVRTTEQTVHFRETWHSVDGPNKGRRLWRILRMRANTFFTVSTFHRRPLGLLLYSQFNWM